MTQTMVIIATYKIHGVLSWANSASFNYKDISAFIHQSPNTPLTTSRMKYNFEETYKWTKRTRGMNDTL